jgi:hypothetical protein
VAGLAVAGPSPRSPWTGLPRRGRRPATARRRRSLRTRRGPLPSGRCRGAAAAPPHPSTGGGAAPAHLRIGGGAAPPYPQHTRTEEESVVRLDGRGRARGRCGAGAGQGRRRPDARQGGRRVGAGTAPAGREGGPDTRQGAQDGAPPASASKHRPCARVTFFNIFISVEK